MKQCCEVQLFNKENSNIFALLEGIVLENETKCLITVVDITELKKNIENELVIAKKNAEDFVRGQKQFLSNMIHESAHQ